MKNLFSAAVIGLMAIGCAQAQLAELSVLTGASRFSGVALGSLYQEEGQDDDTRLKGLYGAGIRFTLNTPGYYGHEFGYIQSRANFQTTLRTVEGTSSVVTPVEDRIRVQQGFYNFLIYFMPAGERWRPFITGGLQLHQYGAPNIAGWPGGGSRNYGANYGGGIKLKLAEHLMVRADVRQYVGGKPFDLAFQDVTRSGGLIRQLEASIGLTFTFGKTGD